MVATFRKVGIAEGISFLVLLGIAMPLKYMLGQPMAVKLVGWAHGMLFIAYILCAHRVADAHDWPMKRVLFAYLAAVLPFGTFVFDRQFLRAPREA